MDNFNNNYNTNHQFDAINIANGHPEYVGTGVLAPFSNNSRSSNYYNKENYKEWSSLSKKEKGIAITFLIILVIVSLLMHWDFFISLTL